MEEKYDIKISSPSWNSYMCIDKTSIIEASYNPKKIGDPQQFNALDLYLNIYCLELILNPHLN